MRKLKKLNLDELVTENIITPEIANKIWAYNEKKQADAPNRLGMALSILGAALIGLGIMLIVAHNWDDLSRPIKTILAFLPMLIGQLACGYTLFKQSGSATWRESSATFLFFAVGTCIGMVSQIYNLEGELGAFLLTWMLLVLPLVYVMQSSIVALLYIGGITWYATNCGYGQDHEPYLYWLLLVAILPYYYQLYQNRPNSNSFNAHSWAIAISILVALGLWAHEASELMWIAYISLLALYFLIGSQPFFHNKSSRNNPYLLIGIFGTLGLFLGFTFYDFLEEVIGNDLEQKALVFHQEFWVSLLLVIASLYLLRRLNPLQNFAKISPLPFGFLLFLFIFFIGHYVPTVGVVLSNLFVLATGLFYIKRGNELHKLSVLNLGLLTIAALIICRFFDIEMSFVTRGILFVMVGIGFFVANYQLLNRRGT